MAVKIIPQGKTVETIAYLYKWTEKSTGKWYVGSRSRKGCHPDDGYICSSKIVKPMVLANPQNWSREILVVGIPKDMRELEARYLTVLNAKESSMSYNQTNGDIKFSNLGAAWKKESYAKRLKALRNPEVQEKRASKIRGRVVAKEIGERISQSKMGHLVDKETRLVLVKAVTGRKDSPETKAKKAAAHEKRKGNPDANKPKPVVCSNGIEFESVSAVVKWLYEQGITASPKTTSCISDACNGKQSHAYGLGWKFKNKETQ